MVLFRIRFGRSSTFSDEYFLKYIYFQCLLKLNIKTFKALFVRALTGSQALVHQQETRNINLKLVIRLRLVQC